MLRKIRIALAAVIFAGITLFLLDISGVLHLYLGWMAKIQFIPAVLALNVAVVVALVALTLLFGRVYCSVICPLGIFQDIVSHFSSSRKGKASRFGYKRNHRWLRISFLVFFVVLLVAGLGSIASLIAPYSAYGKIASNLFSPVYGTVNNILAYFAQRMDSYAFYHTDVYIKSLPTFIVAVVTFVLIVILAWRGGRTWCNNVCPVGTVLGFFSRFSLFRPVINTDKCVNCGQCGKKCKASCIDTAAHSIDYSRCVVCMDCLENCKVGAIKYSLRKKGFCKPSDNGKDENFDKSRRNTLTIIGMVAGAATVDAAKMKVDGGLAEIMDKQAPVREINPTPAGSRGVKHFQSHCISCQACVSNCPNKVLRPSTKIGNFMQPEMSYELGYCRPECTVCSEVCPAGAIFKITPEEKSSIQIGHAVTITQNCVVVRDGVDCGNCARHCPVGAISMVPLQEGGKLVPSVDTERCIGCGACENLCPARPLSAIYVEGHLLHKEI